MIYISYYYVTELLGVWRSGANDFLDIFTVINVHSLIVVLH